MNELTGPERKRLAFALLTSLVIHSLLASLTLSVGDGFGLPRLGLPWQERRVEVPELRVVIAPARVAAKEPVETPVAASVPEESVEPPGPVEPVPALSISAEQPRSESEGLPAAEVEPVVVAAPVPGIESTDANAATAQSEGERLGDLAPAPVPQPNLIALHRSEMPRFVVAPVPKVAGSVVAAAPSASSPTAVPLPPRDTGEESQARAERLAAEQAEATRKETERQEVARQAAARQEEVRLEAARIAIARQEAERLELAMQEALRQEAARREALQAQASRVQAERQEAARQEAARQEAVRQEAARQEAARQDAARQAAALQEAARQEVARQEAARQEAARQEAARQEAARMEAERQAAARQAAAEREAARLRAAKEAEDRREAALRAIGRQLDEEADRRDAARRETDARASRPSGTLPHSWSSARRGRLFGRFDANAELVQYGEVWARKVQLNVAVETVRELANRPHAKPLVTVALRRDGTVESVTFVVSSGVAEVDEAIRRIVQDLAPYPAFQPALANEFDVIEIRRTWTFDTAVRLH